MVFLQLNLNEQKLTSELCTHVRGCGGAIQAEPLSVKISPANNYCNNKICQFAQISQYTIHW